MPQMAPMNWLMLFMVFAIIFMIFNALNYFCFLYKPKLFKVYKTTNSLNWKW